MAYRFGCASADINADKRPDIIFIGASTGNFKWYENLGKCMLTGPAHCVSLLEGDTDENLHRSG